MICEFTSFLTVFQSYQDDGRLVMKDYVQWNSVYNPIPLDGASTALMALLPKFEIAADAPAFAKT